MVRVKRVAGKGQDELKTFIANLGNKVGKVGWFPSARELDGTPSALAAATNEFGDPENHIPPRPFLRPTIAKHKQEWADLSFKGAKSALKGKTTLTNVLQSIVDLAAGQVRDEIKSIQSPPLKPGTIASRLRARADKKTVGNLTKPLIDTGIMYDTLSGVVEDE